MSLVLFAGQSNALGYLNDEAAPYTPTARVQIWMDTNGDGQGDQFVTMVPGWNTGFGANAADWGPEVQFASAWLEANPTGTLYIGKVVKGETPLAQADGLDWSPESRGELFDKATGVADRMMATLGVDHLDAVMWMQGEQDATRQDWAESYADNLRDFLAAARSSWMHDSDGYIGLGRITDSAALPFNFDVRVAQWLVDQEDPDTDSFKTIGFGLREDGVHYTAEGQLALGQGFYDAWIA